MRKRSGLVVFTSGAVAAALSFGLLLFGQAAQAGEVSNHVASPREQRPPSPQIHARYFPVRLPTHCSD